MLKILLVFSLFLLGTCGQNNQPNPIRQNSNGEPEVVSVVQDEDGKRVIEYEEDEDRVLRERKRLKQKIIFSTVDNRYGSTGGDYKDYDSDPCDDYESCKEICDATTRNRKQCYRQPRDLVLDIQDGLFDLINISDLEEVEMNPGLLQGILEIDRELVLDLVDSHMSEGDLKSFLAWVAINPSISAVLERRDRKGEILETAFKELSRKVGHKSNEEIGLSIGLIGRDDTFLALASAEDNEEAFKIGYDILRDACRKKDCKMKILCAREIRRSSRSRSLGLSFSCDTPRDSRRKSSRERVCYVHGNTVWGFLYELVEDKEIRDSDFPRLDEDDEDAEFEIGIEKCNKFCGDRRSKKCLLY